MSNTRKNAYNRWRGLVLLMTLVTLCVWGACGTADSAVSALPEHAATMAVRINTAPSVNIALPSSVAPVSLFAALAEYDWATQKVSLVSGNRSMVIRDEGWTSDVRYMTETNGDLVVAVYSQGQSGPIASFVNPHLAVAVSDLAYVKIVVGDRDTRVNRGALNALPTHDWSGGKRPVPEASWSLREVVAQSKTATMGHSSIRIVGQNNIEHIVSPEELNSHQILLKFHDNIPRVKCYYEGKVLWKVKHVRYLQVSLLQ